ncbi:MAG: glycosyltransferase family 4 protein, partial [Verrucomicrobiota bacterium]
VRFAGFIPQRELQAYYKDATVLVVPSVWPEPIATIGLEAMKSGLPVVGFDSGGIQDWLKDGENGFLVPWMDTKKFAEALDTLMRDKQLAKRMGENGLQQATQKYNFNQYIDRLHNTLMGLSA